jgi:2-C-methyl-D-erythritol 2,4-cyclodiphosphate synthase
MDSMTILEKATGLVREEGWDLASADVTIHLQRPKLGGTRPRIRERLAQAMGVDASRVNVKAKTGEGIGVVGRGEAVEATAIVLLGRSGS